MQTKLILPAYKRITVIWGYIDVLPIKSQAIFENNNYTLIYTPSNQNKTRGKDADVVIIPWLMGFELNDI